MSDKKVLIFEHNTLFSILSEIKEHLNFEIIELNNENSGVILKEIVSDYLIISNDEKKNFKNQISFNDLPIGINKMVQAINIKFLKDKFNLQSDVNIGAYKINLNSREISKNKVKLSLTERETNLIIYLYKSQNPVKIETLQKEVWEYGSKLDTHTVETHIYRLRKKISEKFNDQNFIKSQKKGYEII